MDQGVYSNLNEVSLAKPMPYRTEARARLFLYLFMAGTLVLWAILLIVVLAKDSLAKNKLQTLEDQLSDLKSQTSCTPCSPSWKAFEGSCYYMSRTTALWHDAVKKCAEKEAHLVIINSREEQNFLISNSDDRTYWIGLSSVRDGSGKVKHHRWIDETDLTFTYWSPGEPNDAGDQEDCVVMLSNGRWNDTPCHTDLEKWVCEKRQSC
ncbi:C-type lectin domain family 4 member G-like isoform X4 [Ornithorhynchus anatinus]|uniref:C-type lectin domain family 4 member G-like isoform X4 n=1 Tax=Ornithorhynchus anatinus TaxID=9258 RepID=UPI0010A89A87|nr:C-type lectin domain family 4 member G-like isoform X4 [Ornithorhynchus anatinus]